MGGLFDQVMAHKQLAVALTVSSVVMFVGSLFAVPWLIARAPKDFFRRPKDELDKRSFAAKAATNVLGAVLIVVGALMIVLPGQGILTLLVGVALTDFPGKHALLIKLAKRESVMKALNYFRKRAKKEPFDPPTS